MKTTIRSILFCSIFAFYAPPGIGAEGGGDCAAPQTPSIPDGRRSRESQMQETYTAVQDYLAASQQYRDCLQALIADHDKEAEKSGKAVIIINEMINESLEVEQLVADTFNRELRAFKANNP